VPAWWGALLVVMLALIAIVPFFALLRRDIRQNVRRLRPIGWLMVVGYTLEHVWRLAPAFPPNPLVLPAVLMVGVVFLRRSHQPAPPCRGPPCLKPPFSMRTRTNRETSAVAVCCCSLSGLWCRLPSRWACCGSSSARARAVSQAAEHLGKVSDNNELQQRDQLARYMASQTTELQRLGWTDAAHQAAKVPIEDAMAIVAAKGAGR